MMLLTTKIVRSYWCISVRVLVINIFLCMAVLVVNKGRFVLIVVCVDALNVLSRSCGAESCW